MSDTNHTPKAAEKAAAPPPRAVGKPIMIRPAKQVVRRGSAFFLQSPIEFTPELPIANYTVMFDPMNGFFLQQSDPFRIPSKLYGNPQAQVDRYLHAFRTRNRSTGVILCGQKGSGKTLTAHMLCQQSGLPVLMVNTPYGGDAFKAFINEVPGDAIVLFDEFEKVYDKEAGKDQQEGLLTMLDGNYQARRLFVMTSNTEDVSYYLRNRPGRIFYKKVYKNLADDVITEYIADNLKNKDHADGLVLLTKVLDNCNMDVLSSIVEEMNRFNEPAKDAAKHMNLELEGGTYTYDWYVDGRIELTETTKHPYSIVGDVAKRLDVWLLPDGSRLEDSGRMRKPAVKGRKKTEDDLDNVMFIARFHPADFKFDLDENAYVHSFDAAVARGENGNSLKKDVTFKVRVVARKSYVRTWSMDF